MLQVVMEDMKMHASEQRSGDRNPCSLITLLRDRPILGIIAVIITALIISALIIGGYYLYLHSHQPSSATHTTVPPNTVNGSSSEEPTESTKPSTTTTVPANELGYYEYFNRSECGLLPNNNLTNLATPIKRVIIAHTVTPTCVDFERCSQRIRNIQTGHINDRGFVDIGLNFLVGGDGNIYEGRGYNVGDHSYAEYNGNSICISFIGTFSENPAPDLQIMAAKRFIDDNVKMEKIDSRYALYAHSQVFATTSPGEYLYNQIRTWEHFEDSIIPI